MIMEFAFANEFICNPAYMVCVDFNGKAAYAYLCRNHRILSKVWLYNAAPAPESPEWNQPNPPNPPYLNAREFVSEEVFNVPQSRSAIDVKWFKLNGEVQALIYIGGDLHATMLAGESVGQCRLAKKNGPLAKKMVPVF